MLRLPGRFCIPVFAFLVAYGYVNFSRDRVRYMFRVALVAIIAEPCYWLCFHDHGNAFIPLALALLAFVMVDAPGVSKQWMSYVAVAVVAGLAMLLTRSYEVFLVFAMCICFRFALERDNAWFLPAFVCAFFCNWPSIATGVSLFVTFTMIVVAAYGNLAMPPLRIPKSVAYLFYPGHLLFLALFAQGR